MIFFALLGAAAIAAVLVAVAMSLFLRRHGEADHPAPSWVATDEIFRDPGTDRPMRVWTDRTGGRHYVPDRPDASPQNEAPSHDDASPHDDAPQSGAPQT